MILQRLFGGATGADAPDPAPAAPGQPLATPMHQLSTFLRLQAKTRRFNNQMRLERQRQRQSSQHSYQNVYPNDNRRFGPTQTREGPPPRSFRSHRPGRVPSRPPPPHPAKTVTKSGGRPVERTHPEVLQATTGKSAPNHGQAAEPVEVEQPEAQGTTGGNAQTGIGPTPAKTPQGAGQAAQSANNQGQTAEPAEVEGRAQGGNAPPGRELPITRPARKRPSFTQRRKTSDYPTFGPPHGESPATWSHDQFASWPHGQIGTGSTGQFQQQPHPDQYTPQYQFGPGSPRQYQQQPPQDPYTSQLQNQFGQAPVGQGIYDYPPHEQSLSPSQVPYSLRSRNHAGRDPYAPASQNQYVTLGEQYPQSPTYPKGAVGGRHRQGGKFDAWLQRRLRLGGQRRPGAAAESGASADRQADRADMMSDYMDNLQAMATEPPPPTPHITPIYTL